jgi:lipoprotein NlpI
VNRPALQRKLAGAFFEWETVTAWRGNVVTEQHRLKWLAAPATDADRARYTQDLRALERQRRDVLLTKSLMGTVSAEQRDQALAAQAAAFEQKVRPAFEARLVQANRLMQQQVPARERAELFLYRGESALALGRAEAALGDAREGLKLAPNNPRIVRLKAMAHLLRGEFDASVADFSAVLRSPETAQVPGLALEAMQRRGQAHLLAGKGAEAVADLLSAQSLLAQALAAPGIVPEAVAVLNNRGHYLRAWMLAAMQRQGVTPEAGLRASLAAQATGAWPEPLVGLFTDQVSAEALLQLADELPGDLRLMGVAEANFFIGLKALMQPAGQSDAAAQQLAKQSFEASLRTRGFPLLEYQIAAMLMKRL